MKKIVVVILSTAIGALFAISVQAQRMECDLSKCSPVIGGYICPKDACKPAE